LCVMHKKAEAQANKYLKKVHICFLPTLEKKTVRQMNFRERKERLEYLLEMIEKGRCISTVQIAEKFNCSSKTVERMIIKLRENGHNIKYCRKSARYKLIDKKISSIA